MISLVIAIEGELPRTYGSTYLYALVAWVPRVIWKDRPDDLAQEFALDNIPNWQPGMGLGYSLLAEAYLNFGYVGVFLQYFGIAFGLGLVWRKLYNFLARNGRPTIGSPLLQSHILESFRLCIVRRVQPSCKAVFSN